MANFVHVGFHHYLLDFEVNFRVEKYARCVEILDEKLKSVVVSEERDLIMKYFGTASFNAYICRRNAGEKTPACFGYAKRVTSCLGVAYDSHIFSDESPEAEMMDVAMSDIIANQNNPLLKIKPLVRCLLCKKKCQDGEKLIRSHIWPNSCLKGFTQTATNLPTSMKIFDSSHMNYGTLLSPGQISYPMLCQKCEIVISKFENLFKSKFYDILYDPKFKYANNPDRFIIKLDSDWLFLFCVSMIFRVTGIAANGYIRRYGNHEEIYQLFTTCKKVLMNEATDAILAKLKIAIFLTPMHELLENTSDVSPALHAIIFSKCIGGFSTFTLSSGDNLHDKVDFLLCSIGAINIVAGISENCFDLVSPKSMVISGQKQFIVPSALQRYLMFPKGMFKEFEILASKHAKRVLNTSRVLKIKPEWMFEEFNSFEEYVCSEIANLDLNVTPNQDEYNILNYLPKPFNSLGRSFDAKEISPARVVIHSTSMTENAAVITSVFVVTVLADDYSVLALLQIKYNIYVVWIAYSLSAENYSIKGLLPCKNKKILRGIEEKFSTRSTVDKELNSAILRTGFSSMADLALWMHISW